MLSSLRGARTCFSRMPLLVVLVVVVGCKSSGTEGERDALGVGGGAGGTTATSVGGRTSSGSGGSGAAGLSEGLGGIVGGGGTSAGGATGAGGANSGTGAAGSGGDIGGSGEADGGPVDAFWLDIVDAPSIGRDDAVDGWAGRETASAEGSTMAPDGAGADTPTNPGSGGTTGNGGSVTDGATSPGSGGATGGGGSSGDSGMDSATGPGLDGATGSGGSSGGSGTDGVLCPPTRTPLITDFTYVPGDGAAPTDFVQFGDDTTLSGIGVVYPNSGPYPITSDVTQNNWHISGTMGDYSGFLLVFENCSRVDASAYRGISFSISGTVPTGNTILMGIGTLENTPAASWLIANGDQLAKPSDPGRCIPIMGNQYSHPGCTDSTATIPVTTTPTVLNLKWSDFIGGQPAPSVNPNGILSVYWQFPWSGPGETPGLVDVVIDDLSFIP